MTAPAKAVAITPGTTITGLYGQWGVSKIVSLESRLYSRRPEQGLCTQIDGLGVISEFID